MSLKSLKNANAQRAATTQKISVPGGIARFRPTGDLVLLENASERYSPGGIALPDTVLPPIPVGRVVAKGRAVPDENQGELEGFKLGELVCFSVQAAVALDSDHWLIQAKAIACHVAEPSRIQA